MKCSSFISSFNKLHCNYANVQPCILSKLFKYFCTSYLGSSLWNFFSEGFGKITTLWNIAVIRIFILPNTTHRHILRPSIHTYYIRIIFNHLTFIITKYQTYCDLILIKQLYELFTLIRSDIIIIPW